LSASGASKNQLSPKVYGITPADDASIRFHEKNGWPSTRRRVQPRGAGTRYADSSPTRRIASYGGRAVVLETGTSLFGWRHPHT